MQTLREISFLQQQMHRSQQLDIDETWTILLRGLQTIYAGQPLSNKSYMELYDIVYQYCTNNNLTIPARSRHYLPSCELLGEELYRRLKEYLEQYLLELTATGSQNKSDETLLNFYQKTWNDFAFCSKVVHHIFYYMNRHWVRRVLEDNRQDTFEVYPLTLYMWRENVLTQLQQTVTDAVIKLITKERSGESINTMLVCCVRDSYIDMDVRSRTTTCKYLDYYKQQFEFPLVIKTREYYSIESSEYLSQFSVREYVHKALMRLDEEKARVDRYLHTSSFRTLIDACEDVLVEHHLSTLYDELQVYLYTDQNHEISELFELVSLTKSGLETIQEIVKSHIVKQGLDAIASSVDEGTNDARVYVNSILRIYTKYKQLVTMSFQNHHLFVAALDQACQQYVNRNAVTDVSGQVNKSAELLARYCDFILKKSSKTLARNRT